MTESGARSLAEDGPLGRHQADFVRRAELDSLYHQVRIAVCVNILLAGIVVWAFANVVPQPALLGWWGLVAAINAVRWWFAYRYGHDAGASPRRPGMAGFVTSTLASGAAWGLCAPLLITRAEALDQQLVLLIVMAGLAAGAIPLLAVVLRVYLAYITVLIAPLCAWFLLDGSQEQTTIALMSLVFAAALASAGRNYAVNFRRSRELADALATAKTRTDDANAELRSKIDETVAMQKALQASERRFQTAFEQAPIGIALLDAHGWVTQANPMLANLLGYPVDELLRRPISALVLDDDIFDFEHALDSLLSGRESRARTDLRFVRADGQTLWAAVAMAAVDQQRSEHMYVIVQFQDITESVELSARLQYEAAHDELTGFVNRREFERRVAALLAAQRGKPVTHSLCYLDLDRFKLINDSEGHVAGDEVLRQVAAVVHDHIRGGDTIARIGGDEFAILLEHCDVEAARWIGETLVAAVNEYRFCWNGKMFRLDVSIGVAAIEPEHLDTSDILRVADAACAAAKEAGGARVHVHRALDREFERRQGEIEWLGVLTDALERDDFVLHAQPIVATGARDAREGLQFEILVRMRGSGGEILPPGTFLPAAERYGLAARIDRWVVDAVFAWFRERPALLGRVDSCAINLSGASLGDKEFAEHITRRIREAPLAPKHLRFEITETAAIGYLPQARHFMSVIESLGCCFSLDDFGSGLSSFGYLRSLPVDTLKIDGQFVRDIAHDRVDRALVKSINEIGRVLGLTTIAESVEDGATLETLRDIGVDRVQGFHIGHPGPLAEIFESTAATADDTAG